MVAVAVAQPARKGVFELGLIAFAALAFVDVVTMFLAGATHMDGTLKFALSVFVYIQMAMTAASMLSLPVTLLLRIFYRGRPAAA